MLHFAEYIGFYWAYAESVGAYNTISEYKKATERLKAENKKISGHQEKSITKELEQMEAKLKE